MDWVVQISAGETASEALAPEAEAAAHAAFREHGCVLLRGMFPPATVEAMHQEYLAQFGTLDKAAMGAAAAKPAPNRFLSVGDARFDITPRMTGAFGRPDVFANPRLLKLLGSQLGSEIHLSNFTVVASHPGSPPQHIHRDLGHLFPEGAVGPTLPVYAVNVAVPLIDIDLRTGPTGVWLGSHRQPSVLGQFGNMTMCALRRGDCMLLDYRTLHAGMPNASGGLRPIVYMVYARPWFFDNANHVSRIPLDMPIEHYNKLQASLQPLLTRAFSYAVRARWHEVDGHGPADRSKAIDPSGWGKVGRNDPCPCGSGRKYQQCHARLVSQSRA